MRIYAIQFQFNSDLLFLLFYSPSSNASISTAFTTNMRKRAFSIFRTQSFNSSCGETPTQSSLLRNPDIRILNLILASSITPNPFHVIAQSLSIRNKNSTRRSFRELQPRRDLGVSNGILLCLPFIFYRIPNHPFLICLTSNFYSAIR